MHFAGIDWAIIIVYLILTFAAGLWMRRYVGKVEDYLVAGREMNVHLGIASLAATEVGINRPVARLRPLAVVKG